MPFCCDETSPRFHTLGKPWSHDDYTYASDGMVLVRVDRRPEVPENECAPSNHLEAVLKPWHDKLVPMPNIELPAPKKPMECSLWSGTGFEHDCPDCSCECPRCDGTGEIEDHIFVGIGKAVFDAAVLRRVLTLPALEIDPQPQSEKPLAFRFDGGIGLAMPCVRKVPQPDVQVTFPG
jgi:hypothetical protein